VEKGILNLSVIFFGAAVAQPVFWGDCSKKAMESVRLKTDVSGVQISPAALMKALFVLVVLLVSMAGALETDPKSIGSAVVDADLEWQVGFAEKLPSEITVQVFGFSEEPYQQVESFECDRCVQEIDSFGNTVLKFTFTPASSTEFMKAKTRLSVGFEQGFRTAAAGDGDNFLSQSKYVKLSEEVRSKAQSVAGEGSDFEKMVKITEWVHNSVKYEGLGYRDVILDSTQVYSIRSGKCSEFVHLLLAMARSLGIPAKFVAGFVYTGTDWGQHAWTELLIDGKWVPVDPTFNEMGLLGAGHLKFAEGIDQDNIKTQISAKGIGFNAESVSPKPSAAIRFVSTNNFGDLVQLSIAAPNETVGAGSLETIRAKIKSKALEMAAPLSINMPKDVKIASDRDHLVYLKPGAEESVEWKVIFPPDLEEGSIYNYTVEVSTMGKKAVSYVLAKRGGKATLEQDIEIKDLRSLQSDDSITLVVVVKNTGNAVVPSAELSATLSGNEQHRSFSLGAGEQKEFQVVFPKSGETAAEGSVKITAEGKEILQPFVINLVQQQPEPSAGPFPASLDGLNAALSPEQTVAIAGTAIILIAVAAILFRKPKKPYDDAAVV